LKKRGDARSIDLPHDDVAIDRLSEIERQAIAGHWLHRASAELSVAISFTLLRPRLKDVGAADVVLALADKAIDDEQRHGELCARLAARYLGRSTDVTLPTPRDGTLPDFGTNDERMETALITIGMCCINESIASEWIRSCWQAATAPTALVANKAHLQDEIDHARLGWAHLASSAVSPALKRQLVPWIPKLLAVNVAQWKIPDEHLPTEGNPAHGHLSISDNEDVIDAAVRDVVLPGLTHVGLV
jgi:hypothetical protein